MTDLWSERAGAYRDSAFHRGGSDLDLVVEWCEPGEGVQALDVATGGGHVARRLREAGATVTTLDPAPGMAADVIARAEHIPFGDGTFDVVVCRIAPHHFQDIETAVAEMARVSRDRIVIEDQVFQGADVEAAQAVRDPTHVRAYSEEEWRALLEGVGLRIEAVERFPKDWSFEGWTELTGCDADDVARLRELLAGRLRGEKLTLEYVAIKARRS